LDTRVRVIVSFLVVFISQSERHDGIGSGKFQVPHAAKEKRSNDRIPRGVLSLNNPYFRNDAATLK